MSIFDLRARSYCNLGELISWNISDDYAQGNGLIKCRGQLELKGLVRPAIGDPVLIGYEQPGVLALIPRKLRVQSVFCDPLNFITKIDIACKLTYLQDLKGLDDGVIEATHGEDSGYSISDKNKITIPVKASYAMSVILDVLQITAASNPLTTRFSLGRYVFKEGYVKALDDLLISECYRGFLDENEILQIRSASDPVSRGPVIYPEQIIALGPINVGRLPGDSVSVRYTSIKIEGDSKEKDDDENEGSDMETLKARWELDESKGELAKTIVQYTVEGDDEEAYPNGRTYTRTWQPITETRTTYKIKNVVLDELGTGIYTGNTLVDSSKVDSYWIKDTMIEKRNGVLSSGAGNVCSAYLSNGLSFLDAEYFSTVTTDFEYDDDGNEIKNIKTTEEPQAVVFGRLGLKYYYEGEEGGGAVPLSYNPVITDKVIVETKIVNGSSKTYTTRWLFYPLTQEGQQSVAETRDYFKNVAGVTDYLDELLDVGLVCVGTSSQSQTKSWDTDSEDTSLLEPVAEGRPSLEELNNDENMKKGSSESRIAWAIGSYLDQRRVEFTLPNAPDDYYISERDYFLAVRGYAYVKAVKFGITENRMLLGNRNGMNVQLPISLVPPYPLDAIYINANGYVAQYLMNGTQYVGNKDGIVVTSDLMYWAGAKTVDTPAGAWIPTALGSTDLPKVTPTSNATPSPANAVAIPTGFDGTDLAALFGSAAGGTGSGIMVGGIAPVYETELVDPLVVPPFTLTVEIHGGIGIGALMGQYGYALSVSLDVAASVVGVGARILQNVKIAASAGGASLVLSGARLICGRRAIALPVAFAVTANAAGFRRIYRLRGQPRTLSAAFNSADLRKGIVPTYKLAAAAGGYAITGGTASMVKGTDTSDPYFANVSLLLDMEGLTLSQALVDRSSQDRSVSSTGGTSLSTSVFKYGQSSIYIPTYNYLNISSTALSTTGAYTIEMWFRLTAASGIQCLLTNDYPSNALLLATSGSEIMITIGGDSHSYTTSGAGITANTWYHVALVGTGGPSYVNTIYLNGYNIGSLAQAPVTTSDSILCGAQHGGNHWFNGYFDEIRITNGVARYTAAFTPPTASFPTSGAPIVTSGLTVYLDAGNAASYSGTGTTWTDLSGNGNNGTLVNGVGYSSANGGLLVFDGANDYVSLTNTIQFDNSDFTITGWFKADASQSNAYANVWQSGYANSGPLIDANIDNGLLVCDVRGPAAIDNLVATSFSVNTAQWFNFALVRTGSTVSLYVNGSLASSISGSFSFDVDSPGVVPVIGNGLGNTNNRFFKGSIPVIGAYSRALTAAEITQNFNALRARFGL